MYMVHLMEYFIYFIFSVSFPDHLFLMLFLIVFSLQVVASGIDERTLKREGVCAASLPTTMVRIFLLSYIIPELYVLTGKLKAVPGLLSEGDAYYLSLNQAQFPDFLK